MNQNYNSLLSRKKNLNKIDFHNINSKPIQKESLFDQKASKSQEKIANLSRETLVKEIQVFSWRSRTSLPVLKIAHYAVYPLVHPPSLMPIFKTDPSLIHSPTKSKNDAQNTQKISAYVSAHPEIAYYEVRAKTEDIKSTLQDIEMLPIPQVIYLLKEVLIGFELLIDIFGVFEPTQRMIVVNHRLQWRVWINEGYIVSSKETPKMTQKQFIYAIVKFVEAHAPTTTQSKLLFHNLAEATYQHDCSFIRVLQKVNQFAAVNKIFNVNKVIFGNERVVSRESDKYAPYTFHTLPSDGADNLKKIKANLQKLTTSPLIDCKTPKKGLIKFPNNRSTNNLLSEHSLMHSPSCINLPLQAKSNITYNYAPLTPPVLAFTQKQQDHKESQFDRFFDNWDKANNDKKDNETPKAAQSKYMSRNHFTSGVDFSQIIYSPIAYIANNRPSCNPNLNAKNNTSIKNISTIISPSDMKRATIGNQSPAKNRKQMKQIFQEKIVNDKPVLTVQSRPVSRLDEGTQKRINKRKYSEQIIKMKSLEHSTKNDKFGHISTIYNPTNQIRSFNKLHEPFTIATPTPKTLTKGQESSPDVKGESSPNNSSSTKQIQKSGQLRANYTKLKTKDLGGAKNNQSTINIQSMVHMRDPKKDKNMAVSYQFQKEKDESPDSESSLERVANKKETKWTNKISGLFSDTVSIKHLKQSIKIKTKQEEHFEKEYLKDVKLDLLDQFGRKANYIVEDDGKPYSPYKSMQLIQEQIEEGKSYLDEEMRFDDFPKETTSMNQTMQISPQTLQKEQKKSQQIQCNTQSFDDKDLSSEIASSFSDN